ncbi:hypothetical protein FS837_010406 [Tulasnella sp. UAMH 9824]|nr:hypothetical protein FS837_010406 [Tulasnella sp. UAMH 9824]
MESRPPRSTNDTELHASHNVFSYDVFAFAAPTTPRSPGLDSTSAGERLNETSSSGTLSTPYSSMIATPHSIARPSNVYSRHDPQTPMSFTSRVSSAALRTASSRPPFAFLPPPELGYDSSSSPATPLPQSSASTNGVPSTVDKYQDEKFSYPMDIEVGSTSTRPCSKQLSTIVGEEDSPYPEVRASVANTDDPDMPTLTFRMWLIGITLCVLRACLNLFFDLRWPSPAISETLVAILAYPFGKALDRMLPIRYWTIPPSIPVVGGRALSLNPGPFNIKEHTLVYMMSSVAGASPYGMNMIITTEKSYGTTLGTGFAFLFLLGTEITGFAFVAIGRSLFIHPASIIWPNSLVTSALLNTLHAEEETRNGQMTRYRFFVICGTGAFIYYFLPGYLFTGLSAFSWVCWISPNNVVVNQLFGTVTGLGMGLLTFDWSQVAYLKSPLVIPWWASVNVILGFVLFSWILAPILYYSNVWNMGHLPIMGYSAYDRFGLPYDTHRVLTPDKQLNVTAYQEYSPVYLPVTFALTYLVAFMITTSIIVQTMLYEGPAILAALRGTKVEDDDIHAKLMRHYPEVPSYYYVGVFIVGFSMLIGAIQLRDVGMPIWSLFLAMILPLAYLIPCAYIYAKSGTPVPINLVAQIIPGAILPGRPIANMVFKTCAIQSLARGLSFLEDLKLGHYLKIPPYASFWAQLVATIISVSAQIAVKNALFAAVPDICEPSQPNNLVCPSKGIFYSASIIWGLIGASRQFGKGSVYNFHVYGLVIGALLPIPIWLWHRRHPKSIVRHFNISVFLSAQTWVPPATGVNFTSYFIVAFLFQYLLRVRRHKVWAKFNYILSCALEAGTGIAVIVIFLALQLPKAGRISFNWWGNTVWLNTADAIGVPYLTTDPDKGF